MSRVHLFEIADQPWFPSYFRDALTDFLSYAGGLSEEPYVLFAQKIKQAMARMDEHTLLDLCSGASGPVVTIGKILREREGYPVEVKLTDLHPNLDRFALQKEASGGTVDYVAAPVDATAVPAELEGFRTIVNGLHHFQPDMARSILADAARSRRGIAILEMTSRTALSLLVTALSPLNYLLTAPLIRPFRPGRLVFTYLLPIMPLVTLFDGIVSCLRVYSPEELRALVAGIEVEDYEWDIGLLPFGKTPLTMPYLIGAPL